MGETNPRSIRHLDANGLRFAYIEEGDGPLVLLCHGFPDSARTWDDLRPRLARAGYRAVSPFMRGYAPTEIPSSAPDAPTLGRDLIAIIDALGAERACVVGHDWGGLATYAATTLAPERIEYAIVSDVPHPMALAKPPLRFLWNVRHFFLFNLPGAAARFRKNDFAMVGALFRRWSPTWRFTDADLDEVREALSPPGAAEAAVAYYRMARSGRPEPLFEQKIRVPMTVVTGRDHPFLERAHFEAGKPWHEAPLQIEAVPGGHFLHRESPDAFAELVLSRLPAPIRS